MKNTKIAISLIFIRLPYLLSIIWLTTAIGGTERLSDWINHCFASLPENVGWTKENTDIRIENLAGIKENEITELFECFKNIKDNQLSNPSLWLGPKRCQQTFTHKDLSLPYVQKLEAPINSRICIIGDLHGSIHALLRNLLRLHAQDFIDDSWKLVTSDGIVRYLMFTGDFVDSGAYGIECWSTIMKLFNENPDNVMIVRGNHEQQYWGWKNCGFTKEIKKKFGTNNNIESQFNYFCNSLPHALFLNSGHLANGKAAIVQCSHGGIEPSFDPINLLNNNSGKKFTMISQILDYSGFMWSDFSGTTPTTNTININNYNWHLNDPNFHFKGYCADITDTQHYLKMFGISGFFRGHQDKEHSLKLIKRGTEGVVKWDTLLSSSSFALDSLKNDGIPMNFFLNKDDTIPVFTFSTATEGRNLTDEGFCIVTTAASFSDWNIKPHIYVLQKLRQPSFVGYSKNNTEVIFSWTTKAPHKIEITKKLNTLLEQLRKLQKQLELLNEKLNELKIKITMT